MNVEKTALRRIARLIGQKIAGQPVDTSKGERGIVRSPHAAQNRARTKRQRASRRANR